jgi:hypothetical protein
MARIAIVTSLRARALSADWAHDSWLLERMLHSALGQTVDDVAVLVVGHERPDGAPGDSRVRFVRAPFAPPARDNDDMCADKVAKLSLGIGEALRGGCGHVLLTDADDLLHREACAWLRDHPAEAGWYSASELFYVYGGRMLRRYDLPGTHSGPCAAFRADVLEFDRAPFGEWRELVGDESAYLDKLAARGIEVCTAAAVGHTRFRELLARRGHEMKPFPFPGNVVINHSDSTSHVPGGLGSRAGVAGASDSHRGAWRRLVDAARGMRRHWRTLRPIDARVMEEFSVLAPGAVPQPFRHRGSLF